MLKSINTTCCVQLVDAITMAGAQQQDAPAGRGCSPHSQTGSQAASQSESLASLQAFGSWLQRVPAAMPPMPLGQPFDTEVPSVPLSRFSLAEQQHVFMQGVHAGMQINSLSAADAQAPSPGPSTTPSSWPNLEPEDETPLWIAKCMFDCFQPGQSQAGLPLPPQYSASSSRIGESQAARENRPV